MNDISVDIAHLVLDSDSVAPGQTQHLAQMTALALQRLLEQHGWPGGLASHETLEITVANLASPVGSGPEHTAPVLALALYQALEKMK